MQSDLLFSLVLCGKRTKVRRKIMKRKMTRAAGLAGGVVWGVVGGGAVGGGGGGEGGGAGAASYRAEGHQPDDDGRGHCFAAERSTCNENAGDWAEYVAVGDGGAEVLADLQPLREGLARSEQSEVCAVEAIRGDVGNDDRPRCTDLCPELAGGGRAGAGAALEVCAGSKPGPAGKEGGNVFSIGPSTEHDDRSAIVFADSVGAREGIGRKRYQRSRSNNLSRPTPVSPLVSMGRRNTI